MVESGHGINSLCLLISVLQIITRATIEGKSIQLDVSRIRINPLECYDRTKSCAKEAKRGYCESNYHYMIDRCPWSCRFCRRVGGDTEKCIDISENCAQWVARKECTTRPDFMAQNCKKSCEMCGPESDYNVTDTESACPLWAKAGWCETNADLLDKCPHSCQKYGVQGASSLDERYITVNFRNSSSATVPEVSTIVAPPPPSAAISAHSELDTLPPDLRAVLANEWWDPKLLKLTQKQNEYVTHPEPRPISLPLPPRESNKTAWTGNNTHGMQHSEQRGGNATRAVTKIDRSEQGEMLADSASAPTPRAYDALLPKLFLSGGPTWAHWKNNPAAQQNSNYTAQGNQTIWKEEQEEDEDLNEGGQQKGKVPVADLRKEEEDSGYQDLDIEMSSSGSGKVNGGINAEAEMRGSGEQEVKYNDKIEQNTTFAALSSWSGEVNKDRNIEREMTVSGEAEENDDDKTGQKELYSGSGEQNEATKHHIAFYSSEIGDPREKVKIISAENSSSGSG